MAAFSHGRRSGKLISLKAMDSVFRQEYCMSKRWLFLLAGLGILGVVPVRAQDIEAGRLIAKTWCSRCHAVDAESHGARNDAVPSFLAISKMSSTTQRSLTVFLSTSHGSMPDFSLTRTEIRNVSAYILSLREGH